MSVPTNAHDTLANVHEFEVVENKCVADGIWRMRCNTTLSGLLRPGQFVNVDVPNDASHILRIPLSFSKADAKNNELELVYAVVGEGTKRLSAMCVGDTSTMVGPCGNGWSLPKSDGRSLLVAGGVGLPPIMACARMLAEKGIGFDVIVGAQTASRHVEPILDELRALPMQQGCDCARTLVLTTDDGTRGMRGFVTTAMQDMLAERSYATCYSCGPNIMMRGVAELAHSQNIACQVSLERMMGCGFGACSCCNVELVGGGFALCCSDGPVFDASEVVL